MGNKVLICGVWDCCHAGHIKAIRTAEKLGDVVVGVVTDESAFKFKGRSPIFNFNERTRILSELGYSVVPVDCIKLSTYEDICRLCKINVFAHSDNFIYEAKERADLVNILLKKGIMCVAIPHFKYISTTEIISRIKQKEKTNA